MEPNNMQPGQSITPTQPVQPINGVVSESNPYTQSNQINVPVSSAQPQPVAQSFTPPTPSSQPQQQPQPFISEVQPTGVVMPAPQQPQSTGSYTPNTQPVQSQPVIGPKPKKPKFVLIIIIGLVLIVGMTVAGVLLAKPKKKAATDSGNSQTQQTQQPDKLQPASALDVEQVNTSVNQDISGIDDEVDFPPSQLDDKALEL